MHFHGEYVLALEQVSDRNFERSLIDVFVTAGIRQIIDWIVRDPEGNFWIVPPVEKPWENRESFTPTEETNLEPVPGHYKYMLGLPY